MSQMRCGRRGPPRLRRVLRHDAKRLGLQMRSDGSVALKARGHRLSMYAEIVMWKLLGFPCLCEFSGFQFFYERNV